SLAAPRATIYLRLSLPPDVLFSQPAESSNRMDAEDLFRQHLTVIGQIAESICRRNAVSHHDAEDFAADTRLRLVEDDFAVIRKFQGKSSFTTYLTVVINKRFLDHRRRIWGKWSPSSQARRLGPIASLLETLVYRDGMSFDAAYRILEQKHQLTVDRRDLQAMLAQLPRRSPRRFEGEDGLDMIPSADNADSPVLADERDSQLAAAEEALRDALQQLSHEDRAIIKMLYYEDLSVADIARGLGLEQKRLYPRIKQLLASLGQTLKSQGISADLIRYLDST
ncbi:MAG: sigma-70 family RNA polymerase sigma factor, partial [bacterium]